MKVRVVVYIPAGLCRVDGSMKMVLWKSSVDRLDTAQLLTWAFGVYCVLYVGTGFTKRIFI